MSHDVVFYLPWPDGSFLPDIKVYVNAANRREHKQPKTYHIRVEDLANITSGYRLYVPGHGNIDRHSLVADKDWHGPAPEGFGLWASTKGERRLSLTPDQLINKLKNAGIKSSMPAQIRLLVCTGTRYADSFAKSFALPALKEFPDVDVYGYKDLVMATRIGRKRTQENEKAGTQSTNAKKSLENLTQTLKGVFQRRDAELEDAPDITAEDEELFNGPFSDEKSAVNWQRSDL
jgi:hypothetical protein